MTPRDEYMAILAALCVTDCEINPTRMAAFALDVWKEGDKVVKECMEPRLDVIPGPTQPPKQPDECRNGCPPNQVCDYCQGIRYAGKDKGVAA